MEIEKSRETSWKIQLEDRNETVQFTSVEVSGLVESIKLTVVKNEKSIKVEMNRDEFFNFLALVNAFKDVVIGDESILEENLVIREYSGLKDVDDTEGEELYENDEVYVQSESDTYQEELPRDNDESQDFQDIDDTDETNQNDFQELGSYENEDVEEDEDEDLNPEEWDPW